MTSPVGRSYATALALMLFFLTWAVVATKPWIAPQADPRLERLSLRELQLRRQARQVDAIVGRRLAAYHRALAARHTLAAAPTPAVRVVNLPPVTITRTS